jgi:hypothetical protein
LIFSNLWKTRPFQLKALRLWVRILSRLGFDCWAIKAAGITAGIERLGKIEREGRRPMSVQMIEPF